MVASTTSGCEGHAWQGFVKVGICIDVETWGKKGIIVYLYTNAFKLYLCIFKATSSRWQFFWCENPKTKLSKTKIFFGTNVEDCFSFKFFKHWASLSGIYFWQILEFCIFLCPVLITTLNNWDCLHFLNFLADFPSPAWTIKCYNLNTW